MTPKDELKKLSDRELLEELNKSQLDLYKLRLAVSMKQSKETTKLKALRRHIARIKTVQRMLKIEQVKENSKSTVVQ